MDGWSLTQQMIVYKGKLLKNLQIEIKARPVNAGHYMAFKHRISFATNLAANFGCNRFRITPDIGPAVPSFCAPPSEDAVLFYSNLSRRPFL